ALPAAHHRREHHVQGVSQRVSRGARSREQRLQSRYGARLQARSERQRPPRSAGELRGARLRRREEDQLRTRRIAVLRRVLPLSIRLLSLPLGQLTSATFSPHFLTVAARSTPADVARTCLRIVDSAHAAPFPARRSAFKTRLAALRVLGAAL